MNKLVKLFSILFLITLIFVGCSGSNESNAKKIAEEFGRNLYTVDTKKVSDYNALLKTETIQSFDKTIQPLMTGNGYKSLIANRDDIMNTQGCAINNYTMQVTNFILTKNFYDDKQNTAGYYYEAKLKFVSDKDKKEQTDVGKGYIGLSKENGQWKVSTYQTTIIPDLVMKR